MVDDLRHDGTGNHSDFIETLDDVAHHLEDHIGGRALHDQPLQDKIVTRPIALRRWI